MGFLDGLGSLAKGALNSLNEYNAEIQALKEELSDKSSSELRSIVKNDDSFFFSFREKKKNCVSYFKRER
ncbi:hypothetical protein BKK49_03175 [Rodentibacter rarus]|uniref:Uncharacterized protein n=1 Tax=Rodentibacter rarus TaxID=1908260 RepID=A0A1V3IMB3_9PAST|nr:hypothetical protein [Rodentibacter rarus]OOF42230.1 hypothetical protein BKK49_03175 [Rodentibacter rarus]OOF43294.1 hypothetical protein BKK50_05170 [Rodentibacter rarus]